MQNFLMNTMSADSLVTFVDHALNMKYVLGIFIWKKFNNIL